MNRHSIVLRRTKVVMSSNTIETDALNAMGSIPGIEKVEIESTEAKEIKLSYSYSLNEKFWQTDEYLGKFDLERADWS